MKKCISLLLSIVLVCIQLSFALPSEWADEHVNYAIQQNIVTQRLLSNYQNNITREEFAEMVVLLYERLSGKIALLPATNPFNDTSNPSVLKANALGIVGGKGNGIFAPVALITRQEIAVMFLRTLKAANVTLDVSPDYRFFADENLIDNWAKEAVQTLNKLTVLGGVGNDRINPLGNATREQAITLTSRTYQNLSAQVGAPPKITAKTLTSEQVGKLATSVVKIYVEDVDGSRSTGSGFFYDKGKIATNFHVIENAKIIQIEFEDDSYYTGDVKVLGYDRDLDLAAISIQQTTFPALDLGNSDLVSRGQNIYTIGSPVGLMNTLSNGLISSVRQQSIQITAPISPGSSGGALIDEYGKVVGITNAGIIEGENLGFAIPINLFKTMAKTQSLSLVEFVAKTNIKPAPVSYVTAVALNSTETRVTWQNTGADYYHVYESINGGEWQQILDYQGKPNFDADYASGLTITGYTPGHVVEYAVSAVKAGVFSDYSYSSSVVLVSTINSKETLESYLEANYSVMTLNGVRIYFDDYNVSNYNDSRVYIYGYIDTNEFLTYRDSEQSNLYKLASDTKFYANQMKSLIGKEVVFTIVYSDYYSFYPSGFVNNYIYSKSVEYSSWNNQWYVWFPLIDVGTNYNYFSTWASSYSY